MKVVCDRASLAEAVNLVAAVAAARSPRPQMTCVKLAAASNKGVGELTLVASDGELGLRLKSQKVDVAKPGSALIPADKLRQVVSAQESDPTLTIEVGSNFACTVKGQDATFTIYGHEPEDPAPVPEFEHTGKASCVFAVPAATLSALIAQTSFATARENSRYAINGVLLKRDGRRLELVATDGRRLALSRASIPGAADKDAPAGTCIVPTKALSLLQRLLVDPQEKVLVAITDNQVLFVPGAEKPGQSGRALLASTLVQGAFPPYEEVIPKDQDKRAVFDREVLSSAVRRASVLTSQESRGVRMRFDAGGKKLELSSRAPEMGESQVSAPAVSYEGQDVEIGFNPQFISDALRVIDEPQITIELKASNKPGLFKSGDFTYVVMPVSLQ